MVSAPTVPGFNSRPSGRNFNMQDGTLCTSGNTTNIIAMKKQYKINIVGKALTCRLEPNVQISSGVLLYLVNVTQIYA